jgi:hypothetical protein
MAGKNKLFWAVNITFTHLQNKMLSAQQNKHARGAELSCPVIEHAAWRRCRPYNDNKVLEWGRSKSEKQSKTIGICIPFNFLS